MELRGRPLGFSSEVHRARGGGVLRGQFGRCGSRAVKTPGASKGCAPWCPTRRHLFRGPQESAVSCVQPETALGQRLPFLFFDLAEYGLRGLPHLRVCPPHRGLRVSRSMRTDFMLDAPGASAQARAGQGGDPSIPHRSSVISIHSFKRLTEAGVEPSVLRRLRQRPGRDDQGLCQIMLLHRRAPHRSEYGVTIATPQWVG